MKEGMHAGAAGACWLVLGQRWWRTYGFLMKFVWL